jgi:predicted PurR-regulated permease PerM
MIGAKIDGMLGIIFAIPVASALNVVYRYMLLDSEPEAEQSKAEVSGEGLA